MALSGGVVLLEEVCPCGGGLGGLIYSQTIPSETDHFLLPLDPNVDFQLWYHVSLHAALLPAMTIVD